MRIVWFSWKDLDHPLTGGAEVVTDQLLTRAVKDGHEVVLVTGSYKDAKAEDSRNGYKIIRVGNRLTVYLQAWLYYRKNLKNWAELVIDECNTIPFFTGWYAGKNVKYVMFFHMLCRRIWFYELPKPLGVIGYVIEPIYLRMLKRSWVVTVSESTKQDLIHQGFRPQDIHIISEGLNIKPLERLADGDKYDRPTVLSFGGVRTMKRTLDQVRAFELAKQTMPNLQLKVAGDTTGKYGEKVLATIKASQFQKDIEVLGKVSNDQKRTLMSRCHAILVTSVKEGWGLIVTEANSQGTPAVVYNVDGLRDSVQDGKTGIVTATTPQALATGLTKLLQDPERYATITNSAYEWSKQITFEQSYADFKKAVKL